MTLLCMCVHIHRRSLSLPLYLYLHHRSLSIYLYLGEVLIVPIKFPELSLLTTKLSRWLICLMGVQDGTPLLKVFQHGAWKTETYK